MGRISHRDTEAQSKVCCRATEVNWSTVKNKYGYIWESTLLGIALFLFVPDGPAFNATVLTVTVFFALIRIFSHRLSHARFWYLFIPFAICHFVGLYWWRVPLARMETDTLAAVSLVEGLAAMTALAVGLAGRNFGSEIRP